MNTTKKLLILLLTLTMMLCFAACGEDDQEVELNEGDANCDHTWNAWETVKENSCTDDGVQIRACSLCGKEEQKELLAFGHAYYDGVCSVCEKKEKDCEHPETHIVVIKEADCENDGSERTVCNICNAVVDYDTVYAFNHNKQETVVVAEPTCTENGMKRDVCKLCGKTVNEYSTWPNGHSYEHVDGQQPTCTEIGWYSYSKCSVCQNISGYEERSATGHSYRANTCSTCGYENPAFDMVSIPGITVNAMTVPTTEAVSFTAETGCIGTASGEIKDKKEEYTWTLNADMDGRYFVWLSEVYNNYYINVYVYNALGERVGYEYLYNNRGLYLDLAAGEYTIKLKYGNGLTTYNLNIGYAKPSLDITSYDVIVDEIEFTRQMIQYTFVPSVSGVYYFHLSEMVGNAEMYVGVYNRLNERMKYDSYVSNGEGIAVELTAGETYTVKIENSHGHKTPFYLNVGRQTATVDISGYTTVSDNITFKNQTNCYTFVATSSECRIELNGVPADKYMSLNLYNHLGERLQYDNYCYNGEGFNVTGLTVGNTYTIKVGYQNTLAAYTLNVFTSKPVVEINSDMGVRDTVEYGDQTNVYTFTVDREGNHKVMLLIHSYEDSACLSISIYDANGKRVKNDSTVYDGNYFDMGSLAVGVTYTIHVNEYSGDVDYTLSIQE